MWEKLGFAREHELENGRGNGAEEGVEEFVPATAAFEEGTKDGPTTADDRNNEEVEIRMESEDPPLNPSTLELCGSCGCLSAMMIGISSTEKEKKHCEVFTALLFLSSASRRRTRPQSSKFRF